MLIDLALLALFSFFFHALGWLIHYFFRIPVPPNASIVYQMLGISVLLYASKLHALDNLNLSLFVYAMIIVASCYRVCKNRTYRNVSLKRPLFLNLVAIPPILLLSFLLNPSLWTSQLRMRVGPDPIGWLSTFQFFCERQTISELIARVENQSKLSSWMDLIKTKNIYSINSFSDQVHAEWILGAERTSIANAIQPMCIHMPIESVYHFYNGLILFSFSLTFQVLMRFFREHTLSYQLLISGITISLFNPIFAAMIFESGLAQLSAVPFFTLLFLCCRKKVDPRLQIYSVVLTVSFGLTTYQDLLLISTPFIAFVLLQIFKAKNFKELIETKTTKLLALFSIAHLPLILNLLEFLNARLGATAQTNGWHQGGRPLLAEFLGILPWLPDDGISPKIPGTLATAMSGIASICILSILVKVKKWFTLSIIVGSYIGLTYWSYFSDANVNNNYVMLKGAAFLIPGFMAMMLASVFSEIETTTFFRSQAKTKKYSFTLQTNKTKSSLQSTKVIAWLMVSCVWISSYDWGTSFYKNSHVVSTQRNQGLDELLDRSNVIDADLSGIEFTSLVLLGNIKYGRASRANSMPVDKGNVNQWLMATTLKACQDKNLIWKTAYDAVGEEISINKTRIVFMNKQFCLRLFNSNVQ